MSSRRIFASALLVVATILWCVGLLGVWAQRQALNTDNWVDTSTQLLRNERVRTTLASALLDRLYQSAPAETRLRESLPPNLQPLAAPIAAAVRGAADRAAPRVLGRPRAVAAWAEANRVAHRSLLRVIDRSDGTVTLDLRKLMRQIAAATGLPASLADRLPPDRTQITILAAHDLSTARKGIDALRLLPWILVPLSVLCFGGAIYLREDRRRAVLTVGGCIVLAAIAVLALRRLGGNLLVNNLVDAPDARAAVHDVWQISTSLLADAAAGSLLFGLLLISGAWLAGEGRRATSLRRLAAPALATQVGLTRAALGVAILLLLLWGPVPWTQKVIPMLVFTLAAFAWLEWLRRRVADEFPDAPPGRAPEPLPSP